MPRHFEDYFANKADVSSAMAAAGDTRLVLRAGTVLEENISYNFALATMEDNAVLAGTTVLNAWVVIAGLADDVSTASLAFATNTYTYSGPNQIYPCAIRFSCCLLGSVATDDYEVGIFHNAVKLTKTRITASDTLHLAASIESGVILTAADTIDVRIRNITATNDVTVVDAQLVIDQSR